MRRMRTLLLAAFLGLSLPVYAQAPAAPAAPTAPAPPAAPADAPKVAAPAIALPADDTRATKALTESPRHGEWVTISLGPDAGGKVEGLKMWVSYPERADKAPVVLVIHEIFGLTDWVRAVADQLAAEGFIAVAPDLLSGKGPAGGGTESFKGDTVREAIRALDAGEVVTRLNAARDYATALPSATTRFGCIGFCWGGTTTWTYATRQPALGAGVVYYGTAPDSKDAIAAITCPIVGCYGGDDARVTSTVERTKALAAEAGKAFTAHVYEGAGHGFLRQQSGREGKNEAGARAAWASTIAILKASLEAPKPAPTPASNPAPKPASNP